MKKYKYTYIFILILNYVNAQHIYSLDDDKNYIDSISQLIETTKFDSVKCVNYFNLSLLYSRNKNRTLSDTYLKKANLLSLKFPVLRDISISHNAVAHLMNGNYSAYEKQLLIANEKLKKYNNSFVYSHRASLLKSLAVINQIKQNEKESMRILVDEAIPLAIKSNNNEVISNLYKTIGIIFMNHNDRIKAEKYLKLAIDYIENTKINSNTLQESKVETYVINAENLCEQNRYLEAKISLDKAYAILIKYPKSNLNAIYYLSNGLYYFKSNNFLESIKNYDLGINNSLLNNDLTSLNRLTFAKYKSLKRIKKYELARNMLIELVENKKLFAADNKINYKEIVEICQLINDYKNGYKYSLKYIKLTDSLYEANSKREIFELENKYNAAEKEKRINQLEAQKQKALLISQKNKFNYQIFGLFSVLLLVIILFLWKSSINQKKLAFEKEKNYLQNMSTLKNQKEIEIMQAMINGEEDERRRIARDLHDGVGSRLSALKIKFNEIISQTENVSNESASTYTDLLDSSIIELRQVAYNLIPETLLKLGLEKALRDLCIVLQSKNVQINFYSSEIKDTITQSNQITIYRIVQELIINALKHARCSEIIVDCSQNQNLFLITVEDNGLGFDYKSMATYTGLGFKNIKNRVDLLNGNFEIDSKINKGTSFNIELHL